MLSTVTETYPQPIAQAYGRVLRSMTQASKLDAILRTAEVVARYFAALGVMSFAAREDVTAEPPPAFEQFRGSLAFGAFVAVAQSVADLKTKHPLQVPFSAVLKAKKSPAQEALVCLLQLRNKLGHDLRTLDEGRATQILEAQQYANLLGDKKPEVLIDDLLKAATPICALPLVYINTIPWTGEAFEIQCLMLMGEGEPTPEKLLAGADNKPPTPEQLYVGTRHGMLSVHPKLLWDLERQRATRGIYLIDSITKDKLGYRSVMVEDPPTNPPSVEALLPLLQGTTRREVVPLVLGDGRPFEQVWAERRDGILAGRQGLSRTVDWAGFDGESLRWYANLLQARHRLNGHNPAALIREGLLDGRGDVTAEEAWQLRLLFGQGKDVRRELKRPVLDLRARTTSSGRWDTREEIDGNIITALRAAVPFIARNNDDVDDTLDAESLDATVGSADYVAVREALVNLLVHQDYSDPRMAGQIELVPYRTTMINPGYSLVSTSEIFEGGNLSRNPLIARALKLIGFAELAGSGLRELSRMWRQAGRRRPDVDSDEKANRFRITLDSREAETMTDAFWKGKTGAAISSEEANILGVLGEAPNSLLAREIADQLGTQTADVQSSLERLHGQHLLDKHDHGYQLKPPFVRIAQEANA